MSGDAWWSDGLRFTCAQCGSCCGGVPGTISFTDGELAKMAARLGVSEAEFLERYVWYKYDGKRSLRERDDLDCIMLDSETKRCTIYDVRPAQCRTFPFWEDVLDSPASWRMYASTCPGMGRGELHSAEEISSRLSERTDK